LLSGARQLRASGRRLNPSVNLIEGEGVCARTARSLNGMNVLTPSVPEFTTLWRFAKSQRHAYCTLAPHPEGFQLRYIFNGAVLIGMVSHDHGQLLERARQWRLRLVGDGWLETEHATPASASTRRSASAGAR
jgi:hypothetical protein